MRAPTNNRITQGQHLASKAVDHSASPDPTIYAPVAGVIDSFQNRGTGTNSAGLMLRLRNTETGAMHSFGHCELSYVSVGQHVLEGQKIAKMGCTGYTIPAGPAGTHLHYYIRLANGNYIYPPSIYSKQAPAVTAPTTNQGEEMFKTDEEVKEAYLLLRGNEGSTGERKGWIGQSKQQFFKVARPEADSTRQQLADVKKALANEQARPPKEIVKEVIKIVEKPVEVITIKEVPVEVIVEKNPSWLESVILFIRNILRIKE
jgi:murein DD-endopeptidase MepM/ murein hydrolase activator NlpD